MTVGVVSGLFTATGYNDGGYGALDDISIDYGSKSFTVSDLLTTTGAGTDYVEFAIQDAVEFLPRGTVFNFGGTEFTADTDSEQSDLGQYRWNIPANFGWIEGQKVTVSANLAPAPESRHGGRDDTGPDPCRGSRHRFDPGGQQIYGQAGRRHGADGFERVGRRQDGDADPWRWRSPPRIPT